MYARFTERAQKVLALAQEEATRLHHPGVGTEHILLGLVHEGEGIAAKALQILGVSADKDEKAYRRFLSRVNVSFLTARDPENKISADYGTFQYPESYLINREGKVVMKVINATNWVDEKMLSFVKSQL